MKMKSLWSYSIDVAPNYITHAFQIARHQIKSPPPPGSKLRQHKILSSCCFRGLFILLQHSAASYDSNVWPHNLGNVGVQDLIGKYMNFDLLHLFRMDEKIGKHETEISGKSDAPHSCFTTPSKGSPIVKAKFQVQRLNEIDIKRAIVGPSMNVNLDIPESVGLSSFAPRPSLRLMDVNLGRHVTRRGRQRGIRIKVTRVSRDLLALMMVPAEAILQALGDEIINDQRDRMRSIEKGPYVKPMISNPDNTTEQILEPLSKMTKGNKKQYIANVKVMNYLLQAIPNDIYNLVDALKEGEYLESGCQSTPSFSTVCNLSGAKYVTMVHYNQTGDTVSYDELYDSLVQFEPHVLASRAKKASMNHDPLALLANLNASLSQSHANSSYLPQPYYVTHPHPLLTMKMSIKGSYKGILK
ncbi:hypothetical protein Tco_0989018 [Tanacetum coccineum]|uniref:Uncharacterized protein n=1 Tax=Tanacetum coccineum TaxID=301880 RepID=A0ABQ5ESX7_9ASTR